MSPKKPRRTAPYYSTRTPKTVYHKFLDCYEGNNIEDKYFRTGRGRRRLCKSCQQGRRGGEKGPRRLRRTTPYYSSRSRGVYHKFLDCYEGNNIEDVFFVRGKGTKRKLCRRCKKMSRGHRRAA